MSFKAACIQLSNNDDIEACTQRVSALIRQASSEGAELIVTPENTALMQEFVRFNEYPQYNEEEHPTLFALKNLAKELKIFLVIGSLTIKGEHRLLNRSYVINNLGEIIEHYDKIHLFDAKLTTGERYAESKKFAAGNELKLANTPWGKLGMSICYDLRFPYLYRKLALAGANFLTIPAAFTYTTGRAHWHILVRARAIENACYVFAPNQTGIHPGKRRTFGHSLIVDPWGKIIAEAGEEEGYIIAEIDLELQQEVRTNIPCLKHDREKSL